MAIVGPDVFADDDHGKVIQDIIIPQIRDLRSNKELAAAINSMFIVPFPNRAPQQIDILNYSATDYLFDNVQNLYVSFVLHIFLLIFVP